MKVDLEDEAGDILNKALMGHIADSIIPSRFTSARIREIMEQALMKNASDQTILKAASLLGLHPEKLLSIARTPCMQSPSLPLRLQTIVMPFGPYTVNTFALLDTKKKQCILFDAGTRAQEIMEFLRTSDLTPQSIFITHSHADHIAGLNPLIENYPDIQIFANKPELFRNATKVKEGDTHQFDDFSIRVLETYGHASDGVSYLLENGEYSIMVVGDTLFARSVGKIPQHYKRSLQIIQDKILSQNPDTLLLPGHGPITTVKDEQLHNPFFG